MPPDASTDVRDDTPTPPGCVFIYESANYTGERRQACNKSTIWRDQVLLKLEAGVGSFCYWREPIHEVRRSGVTGHYKVLLFLIKTTEIF